MAGVDGPRIHAALLAANPAGIGLETRRGLRAVAPDGQAIISGEIIEIEPPRRLVLTWRNEMKPEQKAEGYSRVTYGLEKQGASVKLTILHEIDKPGSKLLQSVSGGWPLVLASLKSLLETGEPLEETRRYVAC